MAVGFVAAAALALAAVVSRLIKRRGTELTEESGPGDDPGTADRGPDGIKM